MQTIKMAYEVIHIVCVHFQLERTISPYWAHFKITKYERTKRILQICHMSVIKHKKEKMGLLSIGIF